MTPGDILDQILGDLRLPCRGNFADQVLSGTLGKFDPRSDVLMMSHALITFLRPEPDAPHHTPLSPLEVERLRVGLRIILDSVNAAYARNPDHFYVVQKGGR